MNDDGLKRAEPETTNIAEMNSEQLFQHIDELDKRHKARLKYLRALYRAVGAEEESG